LRGLTIRVAAEIERYCVANPDARDTPEGIAWWVQMQRQADIRNSVPDAIQLLVERGVLERYKSLDGADVYGFKSDHPDEENAQCR
jgi:hypothetical protein